MASFVGTEEDFKRYIGPRVRNLVQQITRAYKKDIGECEHCNTKTGLDAAHVQGKDRNTLILRALDGHIYNKFITIDLAVFEESFSNLHYPLDETILVLCKTCHSKYDNKQETSTTSSSVSSIESDEPEKEIILPIEFVPSNAALFKSQLLQTRQAQIHVTYDDGREDVRPWNVVKFTDKSNVIGNLCSRPEFRQGNWQKNRIKKVVVRISNND